MNNFNNMILLMTPMMLNLSLIILMMSPSKVKKTHPITLMIILIFTTTMICLKFNYLMNSMISMILFLLMIGGLMIIFMYITSLTNNELFSLNYKFILMNFLKISPIIIITTLILMKFWLLMINFDLLNPLINMNEFNQFKNLNNLNYLYKKSINKSSYYIMLYLYYSMICIMNICYKLKIPLRQLMF